MIASYLRPPRRAGLRRYERGVTSVEYALVGALIAVVIAGSVTVVGTRLGGLYDTISAGVACASSGVGC
jgi:pilus assembly protein Flp/PilA